MATMVRIEGHHRIKIPNREFHELVWSKSKRGKVSFGMSELGAELGVARKTVRKLMLEAVELGQMIEIASATPATPGIYFVVDPAVWDARDPSTHAAHVREQRRKKPTWG